MLGAILGDIIGSPYELINLQSRRKIEPLATTSLRGRPGFTDDSSLTMAVARALIENKILTDEELLADKVAESLMIYYNRYNLEFPVIKVSKYGSNFIKWVKNKNIKEVIHSKSNGAAMRVSSVGWMYSTLEETLRIARLTCIRTHYNSESIKCALMVVTSIFLCRRTKDKDMIRKCATDKFKYEVDKYKGEKGLKELRNITNKYKKGNIVDCNPKRTIEAALYAFLETNSFEDCIRTAISIGGDSDTISCIAGAIAEAYYNGIPEKWKNGFIYRLCQGRCYYDDVKMIINFHENDAPVVEGWENELKNMNIENYLV